MPIVSTEQLTLRTDNGRRLLEAVFDEDVKEAKHILETPRNVNPNYKGFIGDGEYTPLLMAICKANRELIVAVLAHPEIDVNKKAAGSNQLDDIDAIDE